MRFVIATRRLENPGGSETFVLSLAESLLQLGHGVVLFTSQPGLMAEEAERRQMTVISDVGQLPGDIDATIALDRSLAIDMALVYPQAVRLYAMHNALEEWLPPPEPGIVAATLAPNGRFETLARGCAGAGVVIRMRQPVDMIRFSPRGFANPTPSKVLFVGNYSEAEGQRLTLLKQAWGDFGLSWERLGHPEPTLNIAEAMAEADIVVGYGRTILEAMACGRPAYVHEHSGSDGWVTPATYDRLEAGGFSGAAVRAHPDIATLRADFAAYSPGLGRAGQDLVRRHHDAKMVAAALVARIADLSPAPRAHDPAALYGLKRLAESHLRAEAKAEQYRAEAKAAIRNNQVQIEAVRSAAAEIQQGLQQRLDAISAVKALAEQEAAAAMLRSIQDATAAKAEIEALHASTSWRLTAPLRALARRFGR
ncbi:MAG: glycosyltransferase [Hyphomicrobium sp.]